MVLARPHRRGRLLGILTVVVLFSGRSRPAAAATGGAPPAALQHQRVEPPPKPRVEVPPPPTDYSIPKVDYAKGLDGAKIDARRGHAGPPSPGFVNAKGKTIYHGKSEEFYPDSDKKKSEEWYAVGDRHGPAIAWDEAGKKTTEGQYFHGAKQGKWTTFRKDGTIATEEMWYRGNRLGPSTTFHLNGRKAPTVEYKNDRRTGPAKAWDEAGKELTPRRASRRPRIGRLRRHDRHPRPADGSQEAPKANGMLHIWATAEDRDIAVWVSQDRRGVYTSATSAPSA